MWKTIDGSGFPVFAFACTECGARWVRVVIPKTAEKKILRKYLRVPFVPISYKSERVGTVKSGKAL